MNMKKSVYWIAFFIAVGLWSCETDSYLLPGETLQGSLIDPDGSPLITEQPHGFKIRLLEDGGTQFYDFWGKADGTFKNTKLFPATYTIVPIDGPFFPVDAKIREVSGVVSVDFTVIPFAKIDADITMDQQHVKATFRIAKAAGAGKIKDAQLLLSKWNPNVGMYSKNWNKSLDLAGVTDVDIQNGAQELVLENVLESGVTYYARVAVLCENQLGRYNLSEVTELIAD